MSRYNELLELIEDAEARLEEVTTEWEWECVTAELEQLRSELDNSIDDWTFEDEVSSLDNIRKSGF